MICKYPQLENDDVFNKNQIKIREIIVEQNKSRESVKLRNRSLKKLEHFTKSLFRSFFKLVAVFLLRKNVTYVAFTISGGLGDMIRERSVVTEITKMFPKVVIDIYNKKACSVLRDIKNIRFFLDVDLIVLTKKRYDIVFTLPLSYQAKVQNLVHVKYDSYKLEVNRVLKNLGDYNKCFTLNSKVKLHYVSMQKAKAGVDNVKDVSLSIYHKKMNLEKFGITKNIKYITFQYGFGGRGNNDDPKCWRVEYWEKLLHILKGKLKNTKIIQVGISDYHFQEVDINAAKKTSLNELCNILKSSLLHIDIDGACTHIAKAVGTKSVVIFGPTDAEYIGYQENINITSSLCRSCYCITDNDYWGKCLLGYDKSLCMDSIAPEFVAEKAVEYLKSLE
ncbi:MAG: hypothetical protein LE180_02005 [Endomicrobium sp.]|uniref:glycosyltransferase family 9 protein n=1 Tax=Candidatus Endomicrobiellum pyrsonymphae TaxID=1408203 RepID=UPI003576693A|nr:hypothetical protein [Endomicrobium sp.]